MADILIQGMEMPTNRDVTIRIDPNGEVYVYDTYPTLLLRAFTLPEGHGRLGDLDALFERMYHLSDNEGAHKDSNVDDALILRDSACYLIEDAPTIVPAERGGEYD